MAELADAKERLAFFAANEGYAHLGSIYIEQVETVPAAFQALMRLPLACMRFHSGSPSQRAGVLVPVACARPLSQTPTRRLFREEHQ